MYESFFDLERAPFSLASDPGCLHPTPAIDRVIRNLIHGVLEGRGCMTLIADPGLGKTLVLRAIRELLIASNAQSSAIWMPTVTPPEFLELLMLNFGIEDIPQSKARRLKALEEFLIRSDDADRVSALIVDEAHKLSDEILEEIRLLSNFETGDRKLLQIVLAGQPELNERLNSPALWQFKQRISTRLTLSNLDRVSVAGYVRFRWSAAGGRAFPFTNRALGTLSAWSGGVPRVINIICHNALQLAFSEASHQVDADIVREACRELDLPSPALESEAQASRDELALMEAQRPPDAVAPPLDQDSKSTQEHGLSPLSFWRRAGSGRIGRSRKSILSLDDPTE